jgi:uncharacterized RDD family membrane protein YckC
MSGWCPDCRTEWWVEGTCPDCGGALVARAELPPAGPPLGDGIELAAGTVVPASLGARLGGYLIDVAPLVVLAVVAPARRPVWRAVLLAAVFLYQVVGVGAFGCTIGKWLCGAEVVSIDGWRAGYGRAVVRSIVVIAPPVLLGAVASLLPAGSATRWVLDVVAFFWLVLVYMPIVSEPLHRGLHDRAAGTLVVARSS